VAFTTDAKIALHCSAMQLYYRYHGKVLPLTTRPG